MRFIRDLSIKGKLLLFAARASAVALVVSCLAFVTNDVLMMRQSKVKQLTTLAEVLASNSSAALSFFQADAAEELLGSMREHRTIAYACLFDGDGQLFASYFNDQHADFVPQYRTELGHQFTSDGYLDLRLPVVEQDQEIGSIYIRATMSDVYGQIWWQIGSAFMVLCVALLAAIGLSMQLQRSISNPILRLAETAKFISEKDDYSVRVEKSNDDEIGQLYDQFNLMLDRIEIAHNALHETHAELVDTNDRLEDRVRQRTEELSLANRQLKNEIVEREKANEELQETQDQLVETSRKAGMAELANGVLHNVGNVLNSVNVSASLVQERIRELRISGLSKTIQLMQENGRHLGQFFTEDERGKRLPEYLEKLAQQLESDREETLDEIDSLSRNVEHIKEIVRAQQSYAGIAGVREACDAAQLMDDALTFVSGLVQRNHIEIQREYGDAPPIETEKSKLLQILVNLIKNAIEALAESNRGDTKITLRVSTTDDDHVLLSVVDNGMGIPKEKLTRIFSHGFTTKKHGHGFGLHRSANAATEMKGSLTAKSDGLGQGATFSVSMPVARTMVSV